MMTGKGRARHEQTGESVLVKVVIYGEASTIFDNGDVL
jgi:hypothetical protein